MTNYFTKLLSALSVAGLMLVTPAAANECQFKFDEYKAEMEKKTVEGEVNLTIATVEPSQLKNFTDQAGDPPGVDASKPYEGYLVKSISGLAMLLIVQGNCVVTTAGPLPVEAFLKAFGLINSSLPLEHYLLDLATTIEYNAEMA